MENILKINEKWILADFLLQNDFGDSTQSNVSLGWLHVASHSNHVIYGEKLPITDNNWLKLTMIDEEMTITDSNLLSLKACILNSILT